MSDVVSRSSAIELGLKFYFTGRACKNNHVAKRYTCDSSCLECVALQGANWRKNNKEKKKLQGDRHRAKNLEKLRQRSRDWRNKNADKERARKKSRREAMQDLLAVLRVEMPDVLKEFGL